MLRLTLIQILHSLTFLVGVVVPSIFYYTENSWVYEYFGNSFLVITLFLSLYKLHRYLSCLGPKMMLELQINFVIPYTVIGCFLAVFIRLTQISDSYTETSAALISLYYVLLVMCGSLICLNPRYTSKTEYYIYSLAIIFTTIAKAYQTVSSIAGFNHTLDEMDDHFIEQIIHRDFSEKYSPIAIEKTTEKDFYILSLAIFISASFIILDFISRPFELLEQQREKILKKELHLELEVGNY